MKRLISARQPTAARLHKRGYSVAGTNSNLLHHSQTVDNQGQNAALCQNNGRFKDRLLSYQGNYRDSVGAVTSSVRGPSFSQVHSPNSADISCVNAEATKPTNNEQGSKSYIFGSENKNSNEKVIVRVKPSPRPPSKGKVVGPKYPVR